MNRIALVTGGNRGIGRGVTEALLSAGHRVAILATRPEPTEVMTELRRLGEVSYIRGSVADTTEHARYLDQVLDRWGRLDVLVNNAGVAPLDRRDLLEADPESFDRVLGINLRGPYFLTQAAARAMVAGRSTGWTLEDGPIGTIVNVSSISAEVVSTDRGDYCLSKAGVAMATRLWAARLAPEGILVYEVRPGIIATDMTAGVTAKYDAYFAAGAVPMSRWGRPGDVGGAVAQLCAGAMPYSTGDVIHVDGGQHIPVL